MTSTAHLLLHDAETRRRAQLLLHVHRPAQRRPRRALLARR